ncbi:MAG: ABC transporter permease, partial [Anaerolineae bacterium]
MLKLVRFLKPYWWMVLLTIALLFAQANADLALPDYLSRIVNLGIQQGGIDSAAPEAIRQGEMNRTFLFMTAENKAYVLERYTAVDSSSASYDKYVKLYPALKEQPIYVLNAQGLADRATLNPIMGKALLSVYGLEQLAADPAKLAEMGKASGFDLSKLPPGTDIWSVLTRLTPEQLSQLTAAFSSKITALGDNTVTQAAAVAVKAEYTALGMNVNAMQINYVVRVGALMLLLTLASVACSVSVAYLSSRVAAGSARDMRRDIFTRVQNFSSNEFDKFSTASLITRTTNDVTQIQMVVIMMMRMVFYAPIMGVGGIIRAMAKASSMWWLIAVAVVTLISMILIIFSISLPKFRIIQKLIDRLNLVMRENLSGMMVIRAFNMQQFEEKRFDTANRDLTSTMLFVSRVMVTMMPLMMLIMNVLMIAIIWVGAHHVANYNLQVGDLLAFMQYAMQIVFSFLMLSFMFIILPRASVSGGRIAEVLDTKPSITDPQ